MCSTRLLAQRKAELRNVKIRGCLSMRPRAVLEADPQREHFHWFNWHYSGYDRKQGDAGVASYIPCNLGEISDYYRRFIEPPDIAVLKTCPMDDARVLQLRHHQHVAPRHRVARQGDDR